MRDYSEVDDTAMTEDEFDWRFKAGVAAEVVVLAAPSIWTDGSLPSLSHGGGAKVITLPVSSPMTTTSIAGPEAAREAVLTR